MEIVDNFAKSFAGRVALATEESEFSYEQLYESIQAKRNEYAKHVRAGDLVALIGDYSIQAICNFFALAELNAVVVPISTEVESEIIERLGVACPNWIVNLRLDQDKLTPANEVQNSNSLLDQIRAKGHAGLVLFSSGSTGNPKAMVHDLTNLLSTYVGKRPKTVRILVFLMFDHIGGLNTFLNGLATGSTLVLTKNRDPQQVSALIQQMRVTVLPSSPTFLNLLLMANCHQLYDLSSIRMITFGTEPMPEQLLYRIKKAFPKAKLLQTFGTSETGIVQTKNGQTSSTSLKLDDPNTEWKVVDGELWIKSKTQVLGYLNAGMERFTDDGWFKTGDTAQISADGSLTITGRAQEIINVGGEKVHPVEIETVLMELDFIEDCLVFGSPNGITGQMVCADVVLSPKTNLEDARRRVRAHCLARVDRYKVPAKVNIVTAIGHSTRFKKNRLSRSSSDEQSPAKPGV